MIDEIWTILGSYPVVETVGDTKYSAWMDDHKKGERYRFVEQIRQWDDGQSDNLESSCRIETKKYSPYKYC